jgi:hypothetical protein
MNLYRFFSVIALASIALSSRGYGQINTVPEGMVSFNLPATGSSSPTVYISLPLISDPSYSGAVSAVTANTISVSDSPGPWTAGSLSTLAAPYFVKFLSGQEMGRVIEVSPNTANTTNTLTLDTTDNTTQTTSLTTSGFSVQVGDTFEVFPGETLISFFGTNTLVGGSSAFSGDSVGIYSTAQSKFQTYFYNTTTHYWELNGNTANANNTVLYPYSSLSIARQSGEAAISFALMGRVAEVPVITKNPGNNAIVGTSTGYAIDMTLSQLAFHLGANWQTGTSSFNADTISIYDATSSRYAVYYQKSDLTWRKSGDTTDDQSNLPLPAGTGISIQQINPESGASAFLQSQTTLPYSLN